MKQIELEDEVLSLQEIVQEFLKQNRLSVSFMARRTCISITSLHMWLKGERELNAHCINQIKGFLNGDFILPAHMVIANLLIRKRLEKEEQNHAK